MHAPAALRCAARPSRPSRPSCPADAPAPCPPPRAARLRRRPGGPLWRRLGARLRLRRRRQRAGIRRGQPLALRRQRGGVRRRRQCACLWAAADHGVRRRAQQLAVRGLLRGARAAGGLWRSQLPIWRQLALRRRQQPWRVQRAELARLRGRRRACLWAAAARRLRAGRVRGPAGGGGAAAQRRHQVRARVPRCTCPPARAQARLPPRPPDRPPAFCPRRVARFTKTQDKSDNTSTAYFMSISAMPEYAPTGEGGTSWCVLGSAPASPAACGHAAAWHCCCAGAVHQVQAVPAAPGAACMCTDHLPSPPPTTPTPTYPHPPLPPPNTTNHHHHPPTLLHPAGKSFEELRFEDYQAGAKNAGAQVAPLAQAAPGGFGTPAPAAAPSFSGGFGAPAAGGFGAPQSGAPPAPPARLPASPAPRRSHTALSPREQLHRTARARH
jgi:hypothetical protein